MCAFVTRSAYLMGIVLDYTREWKFGNTKGESCAGDSKAVAAYVSASSESALHSPVGGKSSVHTLNWKTSFYEGVPETHVVL